jgi:hypothetical protein
VWAGLLTAITTLILLSVLGAAVGLTTMDAATAAAEGGAPDDFGRNSAIWAAVSRVIAFLLGATLCRRPL